MRLRLLATCVVLIAAVGIALMGRATRADTFGSGANTFDIEFVTIGNPGNAADTTGNPNPAGSVPYTYRMGKFEISEQMIDKANAAGWTRHHQRHPRCRQAGHLGELERGGPVRELAQHEHRQHAGL